MKGRGRRGGRRRTGRKYSGLRTLLRRLRLSDDEHDALFPKAYELAYFILADEEHAKVVAIEALAQLPQIMWDLGPEAPVHEQILQPLVYQRAERFETGRTSDDFLRYYLKFLADHCLCHSFFDASVAINVFVYNLRVQDALAYYYAVSAERTQSRAHSHASMKRREVFEALQERFPGVLREDTALPGKEKYRFVYEEPVSPARVSECLARLAPWPAHGRLLRPAAEIERIRTLFDRELHRQHCSKIKGKPRYRIPKFYP
jgi:hypothetical protein